MKGGFEPVPRYYAEVDTPSRQDGLSKEQEDAFRSEYCQLLDDSGKQLQMCATTLRDLLGNFDSLFLFLFVFVLPPYLSRHHHVNLGCEFPCLKARAEMDLLPMAFGTAPRSGCWAAEKGVKGEQAEGTGCSRELASLAIA